MLKYASDLGASDLHCASGMRPIIRIHGDLKPIESEEVLTEERLLEMLKEVAPESKHATLGSSFESDFACMIPDVARFRVNVFRQLNGLSAAFRVIPFKIKTIAELNMPSILTDVCNLPNGLVLVTGPTGVGKSTTLAAVIDHINTNEECHILTVEHPIEFVHNSKKALLQQREVYEHTDSFNDALRAALREDPDVILVGEMRDLETIRLALTAAETGHLVFATVHTSSAAQTVSRIIDVFPGEERDLVRSMLAESLQVVISQILVKKLDGGRIAVPEIMVCTPAVRNMIRKNDIAQIPSAMQTGKARGMTTFQQALEELVKNKVIAESEMNLSWAKVMNI